MRDFFYSGNNYIFLHFIFYMVQILDGRIVADKLKSELIEQVKESFPDGDKYLAIVFLGDNAASKTYVAKKKKF